MSARVVMYGTRFCPYCMAARELFRARGIEYEDIAVDANAALREEMTAASGRRTVPQIWIGDQHVGGFDDLAALDRAGKLDALLEGSS